MVAAHPFKLSVLIHLHDRAGRLLLIHRQKEPNAGLWSCIGGKIETDRGESPFQCAIRESREEAGIHLSEKDLHLFGFITEKNYEGNTHWLMFLFDCLKPLEHLPPPISEGEFALHRADAIDTLPIPETDRRALWPLYFKHRKDFIVLRADCTPEKPIKFQVEEVIEKASPTS